MDQRVTGSIPPTGGVFKRQPHIDVSLPLFLPPLPSKNNKYNLLKNSRIMSPSAKSSALMVMDSVLSLERY